MTEARITAAAEALARIDIGPDDVVPEPFPHAVIDNALPPELADALRDNFPDPAKFARFRPTVSNQKLYCGAHRLLRDPHLHPLWRGALEATPDLATRSLEAFATAIREEHPTLEERFGRLEDLRRVVVDIDGPAAPGEHSVDTRVIAHTPVRRQPKAERPPHVKNLHAFLYGYLDLVEDDDTAGGDYVLYRPRAGREIIFEGRRQELSHDVLEEVRTIHRRHNRLVILVNGPRSIQWISTRDVTPLPLLAHHFTLRLCEPVFTLPFAPGAGPTPYGGGFSAARTLRVLRDNAADWLRRTVRSR